MAEKCKTKVDQKGRITLPKKIREEAGIKAGEVLFINAAQGYVELIRVVENPLEKLKNYTEKEFNEGRTKNIRQYAREKGININE